MHMIKKMSEAQSFLHGIFLNGHCNLKCGVLSGIFCGVFVVPFLWQPPSSEQFVCPEKDRWLLRCLTGEVACRAPAGRDVGCGVWTGHSEAVAWSQCSRRWRLLDRSTAAAGVSLVVECGHWSGEAVAIPVAQCVGHDYRWIKVIKLPSESGVSPLDSRGSRAWRSKVPMPPKTECWRWSVLIACRLTDRWLMTDWLAELVLCLLYNARWVEWNLNLRSNNLQSADWLAKMRSRNLQWVLV